MSRTSVLLPFLCALGACDATLGTDDGAPVLDGDSDCEQALLFPDLVADPANSAYDDPWVVAACQTDTLEVAANGIPDFEFIEMTPNGLEAQDWSWEIPLNPEVASNPSEIPLLGSIGFSITGLPLFGPNEGEFPDPYGDPVYNSIVDMCLGHTAQGGMYHFHAMLADCITAATGGSEAIIGYALDGFPIYGSMGCVDTGCSEVIEFKSSWVQTGDPTTYAWDNYGYEDNSAAAYLDECNGRIGPDGSYRYHATTDFPYILGCYAGTAG